MSRTHIFFLSESSLLDGSNHRVSFLFFVVAWVGVIIFIDKILFKIIYGGRHRQLLPFVF